MKTLQLPSKPYNKILHIPSLGLALVLLICLASPSSSCTKQEENSLRQFLAELSQDGGLTASWRNGTDCCQWEGITCSTDEIVTDVLLASRSLEGQISPSLGNLAGLLYLNLSNNLLYGGLPQELVSSTSILIVDVSFNRLGGDLHELSSTHARPMKVLNISSNLFTGQFPSSTWQVMKNLVALNASNNSFTGQLPTHFCASSPSLAVLDLCYNQFRGSIPPELGSCSMLRVLKVGHNNLSGTFPDELFNATFNLGTLDLGENSISGKIPGSIGHLKKLEELHLNNNNMYGQLPPSLTNCTNLITIDIKSNNFSGELTKVNFSNLPNLKNLDLMNNSFSGKIPESIYSCSNLIALRVSSNKFHGQLSEAIGNLKYLSFLSLANNTLTNITSTLQILGSSKNLTILLIGLNFMNETMPDDESIAGFENLQVLAITSCSLLGKIPHWLSKLKKLELLFLKNNQLTGQIPDWIGSLKFLLCLDISNNSMTGEIPTALMQMPMLKSEKNGAHWDPWVRKLPVYVAPSLQYRLPMGFPKVLDLSNNMLTGEIPLEIGQLKSLLSINLSLNALVGQIPQSICGLTNLQWLDLSSNNLTGTIPAALNNLHFLSRFNVSNNDLEGSIPSGGQFNTFEVSSFNGNPKLCDSMFVHGCGLAEVPADTILSRKQTDYKVAFVIAFTAFFGVGVLYDQIVLFSAPTAMAAQKLPWQRNKADAPLKTLTWQQASSTQAAKQEIRRVRLGQCCHDGSYHTLDHYSGEIPSALMEMPMLESDNTTAPKVFFELPVWNKNKFMQYLTPSAFPKVLNLAMNNFTGVIPEEIGQLQGLFSLNLSSNRLSGEIPEQICILTNLQMLDLSGNHLTGKIPAALNNLHFLSRFNISNNDLEGTIPNVGQFSTFLDSSFGGNPKLCGPMVANNCGSAEASPVSIDPRKQIGSEATIFMTAFGVFFVVGVLYDQKVLARHFG
uniref:Tyrosine-sulfated glycopeptide receptor 1 n=2 Tax=Aegilops tauschii TaxID=37682 RepID=M8BW68_AEGTA